MKKMLFACAILAAATLFAGTWTEDFETAKKISKEKNLPMLLDFTGSDWCYWCKVMDRQVFAEKAWDAWAGKNVVCVKLNFPRDEATIAAKIREQNETLVRKYGVRGFPTFVILTPGGEREIGRTGCPGRDATPALFIDAVKKILGKSAPAAK